MPIWDPFSLAPSTWQRHHSISLSHLAQSDLCRSAPWLCDTAFTVFCKLAPWLLARVSRAGMSSRLGNCAVRYRWKNGKLRQRNNSYKKLRQRNNSYKIHGFHGHLLKYEALLNGCMHWAGRAKILGWWLMVRFQLAGSWCWSALAIAVDSTGGVDIVTLTVSQNLEGSPNAVRCSCHPSVSDLSSMSSQFRQGQCMALTKRILQWLNISCKPWSVLM